ncbi:PilZ domain-containing protein [Hahella ganghwensis]|uniref:PilZ domain-containing protein n=1 Tax=Hahella ganghwensis TaxID=286420 RepID=UPI00035C8285|nr:PilZ domain-containing protein [Hahella ganghwensis]
MHNKNPLDDNLRTEPRLPHNEVIYVEIKSSGAVESSELGPVIRASETVDISANGIQVRLSQPLRVGAFIELGIIREKTGDRYDLVAEVRWQKRLPGSVGYLVGLALLESDDTSIVEWKLAVSAMLGDDDPDHVRC